MAWAIAGFCAMRALPLNYNDNPTEASRPFDAAREGFVFSEGCGVLMLEELGHAQQTRGAHLRRDRRACLLFGRLPLRGARPGSARTDAGDALGAAGRQTCRRKRWITSTRTALRRR